MPARNRLTIAFCLVGSFWFALGQTTPIVPDADLFDTFFRDVAAATALSKNLPPDPIPAIQRVIGLTSQDVETLHSNAENCLAEVARLGGALSALTFESTLQFAESGKVSDEVAARLQKLADRRSQIIRNHVDRLKSTLPASSFQNLDQYVHTPPANRPSLLPLMTPRTATPEKQTEKPDQ
jgi:hypothetical protein